MKQQVKAYYFSELVAKWLVNAINIGKGFYFSGLASRRLLNIIVLKIRKLYVFEAQWQCGSLLVLHVPNRQPTSNIRSFYFAAEQPDSPSELALHYDLEQFHYTGPNV